MLSRLLPSGFIATNQTEQDSWGIPMHRPLLTSAAAKQNLSCRFSSYCLGPRIVARKNVDELMEDILRSIERIKASPKKLRGCILQSDLPSFFVLSHCSIYAPINNGRFTPARESGLKVSETHALFKTDSYDFDFSPDGK
jgi:hypothetical protein